MKFVVYPEVFEVLPEAFFGVVAVRGLDNGGSSPAIQGLLEDSLQGVREKYAGVNIKTHPNFFFYREAFVKLGFNPNKFLSSVEALTSRVLKGGAPPQINNAVNLVNALSMQYTLPMGCHDLKALEGDICVRFTGENEQFTPFGQSVPETAEKNELVYADGRDIRTRRWIWRQSERGKVTEQSTDIFFPIDGFSGNREAVLQAAQTLCQKLRELFGASPSVNFVDAGNNFCEI